MEKLQEAHWKLNFLLNCRSSQEVRETCSFSEDCPHLCGSLLVLFLWRLSCSLCADSEVICLPKAMIINSGRKNRLYLEFCPLPHLCRSGLQPNKIHPAEEVTHAWISKSQADHCCLSAVLFLSTQKSCPQRLARPFQINQSSCHSSKDESMRVWEILQPLAEQLGNAFKTLLVLWIILKWEYFWKLILLLTCG